MGRWSLADRLPIVESVLWYISDSALFTGFESGGEGMGATGFGTTGREPATKLQNLFHNSRFALLSAHP